MLTSMEDAAAQGKDAALLDEPEENKYVGKHTLEEYFKENKQLWIV